MPIELPLDVIKEVLLFDKRFVIRNGKIIRIGKISKNLCFKLESKLLLHLHIPRESVIDEGETYIHIFVLPKYQETNIQETNIREIRYTIYSNGTVKFCKSTTETYGVKIYRRYETLRGGNYIC
jgi:hypothetical protein